MSPIDSEYLQEFRARLLAMRQRLLATVDGLGDEALSPSARIGGGQTAEAPGDTGDLSMQDHVHDVALSLLRTERQLLGLVTAALQRLDRGEYGRCAECGRPVAVERLRALPYTPYCIDCAGRLEREAGGPNSAVDLS